MPPFAMSRHNTTGSYRHGNWGMLLRRMVITAVRRYTRRQCPPRDLVSSGTQVDSIDLIQSSESLPADDEPFQDRFESNYVPTEDERHLIKDIVSSTEEKLKRVDSEMNKVQSTLDLLKGRQETLEKVRDTHQALLTPMRRILPELLQLIFVHCLPTNRNAAMHVSEAPLLLGRVCSTWRYISLHTPELWASIHIVPPGVNLSDIDSTKDRMEQKSAIVYAWLSRARSCPLNISFCWLMGDSPEEVDLCAIILKAILGFHMQWREIDFQVPFDLFKPFNGLTHSDVPMLEAVKIVDRSPMSREHHWPESLNFVGNLEHLCSFTLIYHPGGMSLPSIPWKQLTELNLETNVGFFFPDVKDMLSAFQQCTHLEICTLKLPLSLRELGSQYEHIDFPVLLPCLHTLCVDGDQHLQDAFHMTNIISNLEIPNLKNLDITGRYYGDSAEETMMHPLTALKKLLEQSKCPLQALAVRSLAIQDKDFISCLKLVPDLKDLVIHDWSYISNTSDDDTAVQDTILNYLTVKKMSEEIICPKLQNVDFDKSSPQQLWNFVHSRWNLLSESNVSKLKSVKSSFGATLDSSLNEKIKHIQEEGLSWIITFNNIWPQHTDVDPSPWHGLDHPHP